jgi:hypothetical protein
MNNRAVASVALRAAPAGSCASCRFARGAGWIVCILWVIAVSVYGLWQYLQEPANLVERLFMFGGVSAIALLFFSVCLDRIRTARTDPYREVEK